MDDTCWVGCRTAEAGWGVGVASFLLPFWLMLWHLGRGYGMVFSCFLTLFDKIVAFFCLLL